MITEKSPRLHQFLIKPLILESLPAWWVGVLLAAMAGLSGLLWDPAIRPWVAGMIFAFHLADWASLALLPRAGRSFGPVRPPLLALAGVRAALSALAGVVWPDVGVMVGAQTVLLIASLYATWIEPFRLRVTYQTLALTRTGEGKAPVRILHLGDLHVERLTRREGQVGQLIEKLAPDLILFSGDFVNLSYQHDPLTARHVKEVVGRWHAPLGAYCVSGTPLVETSEHVAGFVEGTELRWLRDEVVTLEAGGRRLAVLGLDGAMWRENAIPRLRAAAKDLPVDVDCRILLYHTPDIAPEAAELGFDLYLCGHTHGGQLRLPFYGAVITASAFGKRFEMGRYQVGQMTLYVTRGLGMEGGAAPRARFLCPPEMTIWSLIGELP